MFGKTVYENVCTILYNKLFQTNVEIIDMGQIETYSSTSGANVSFSLSNHIP